MAIKKYKPISNGSRNSSILYFRKNLTATTPEKSLTVALRNKSGRNNTGSITVRHQGGKEKRRYRLVDFKRITDNVPAIVKTIEYDPNRSANIALITYKDGRKSYVLAPKDLQIGQEIISGVKTDIQIGNCLEIGNIPEGTFVHNVELSPKQGGKLARSAGSSIQILGKDEQGKYVIIKLKSGEVRKVLNNCRATIGVMGNEEHSLVRIGKAGRNRHYGKRPTVRGSVMNPNDHPHGGGEGKSPIGRKSPMTPWGKKALGVPTRNKNKPSTKLIVRRRKGRK